MIKGIQKKVISKSEQDSGKPVIDGLTKNDLIQCVGLNVIKLEGKDERLLLAEIIDGSQIMIQLDAKLWSELMISLSG